MPARRYEVVPHARRAHVHKTYIIATHQQISSLEDRVKLLESSVCEYKVENEVLKRKLSCSEKEREELHTAIRDQCKGAEIEIMTGKLSEFLDKMELESRKQTEYMLELEDLT